MTMARAMPVTMMPVACASPFPGSGVTVGAAVAEGVGSMVGVAVGSAVGVAVGSAVAEGEGAAVGVAAGPEVTWNTLLVETPPVALPADKVSFTLPALLAVTV